MPGIMEIYVTHAENHISNRVEAGRTHQISRKQVELEVIKELDKQRFPIEMKMCWYHAILQSSLFESIWLGAGMRYKLPSANLKRYTPSSSELEFTLPPGIDMEHPKHNGHSSKKARHTHHNGKEQAVLATRPLPPSPSSPSISITTSTTTSPPARGPSHSFTAPTPSQIALAARLGGVPPSQHFPAPPPRSHGYDQIPDVNGLRRQPGDDGAYGSSPARSHGVVHGTKERGAKVRKHIRGNAKFVKGSAGKGSGKVV